MIELLIEAKEVVEAAKAAGRERLEPSALHSIRVRYGMLVAKGSAANPAPATGKRHGVQRKAANLLVRLDGQRDDVLRFATDFRASWDNNQAERERADGEAAAEDLGLLAHARRSPRLLLDPQLHLDHAQARCRRSRRAPAHVRGSGWPPART